MMYFTQDGKHNFVDEHNVVLGYDKSQQCCERAGWYLSDCVPESVEDKFGAQGFDFTPYRFDAKFIVFMRDNSLDDGNAAVFKIVAPSRPDKYIVLFNAHNGYYSHGFQLEQNDKVLRSGRL